MHPFLEGLDFIPFAHRGGALEAAENSLEAFAYAINLGYRYIETDVQLTADGVVVVFHDDVLDRVTGLSGQVSDHTWAELEAIKVHGTGSIPRLEDVLQAWPELRLNIDAKTDEVAAPLCRIAKADNLERLCLASEDDKRISFIREELGAGLCTAAATREIAIFFLSALSGLRPRPTPADCFQIPVRSHGLPLTTKRQLARARDAGKPVHIWTIDAKVEMEQLVERGVGGIMTDRPRALREVLKQQNLWD